MKKLIILIALLASIYVQAQTTWMVDSLNDSGFGSLRAAADSCVSGDTIRFNPNLIANGSDSIVLTSGEIAIDSIDVAIIGVYSSTDTMFVSGGQSSRIFSFTAAGKVVLDSMVLKNGNGVGVIFNQDGGAILRNNCYDTLFVLHSYIVENQCHEGGGIYSKNTSNMYPNSTIYLDHSFVSNNIANNGGGGGIESVSSFPFSVNPISSVLIYNSTISNNTCTFYGGGVFAHSDRLVEYKVFNSTISNNNSGYIGGGLAAFPDDTAFIEIKNTNIIGNISSQGGGGVSCNSLGSNVKCILERSTVANNQGNLGNGGGLLFTESKIDFILSHSTVFNNSVSRLGGGVYLINQTFDSSAVLSLINSTIVDNIANGIHGGPRGHGFYCWNFGLASIDGSVLVNNGLGSGFYLNSNPMIISGGYNLFGNPISGFIGLDSTNVTSSMVNFQPLFLNGGSTLTLLPGGGSIAIDNGNPLDSSDAQNAPIFGIRDIGAAEGCFAVPTTMVVSLCDSLSYSSPSGNSIFTQSGVYFDTLSAACGADSIFIIDLTLGFPNHFIDTLVACDSLTWINGVTYYSNNNTAKDTLVNAVGCDSIVTLNLIINNSTSGVDVITACDSLTWIDGMTYFSSNNTAKDTLVNSVGCDSIVSLDLTILQSSTSVQNLADCDSLTWVNGVTYYQDTIDTYTIINSVGCDSVITLDLNLEYSSTAIDSIIAVIQHTWIDGVTYYAHNSTATYTLTNTVGCDSVVSLYLEIQVVEIGVDQVGSTLIAKADSGTFQWVECPNYDIISGETDSVFTPTQNGSYAVIVTQNGYTDTSDCITVNNVGIGEVNLSNTINIYPNPVHDQVNIEITNWPTNGVALVVRDITGKKIYSQEVEPISNRETISINTTKWAKGTYFIEVANGENRVVEKIVVR